LQQIGQTDPSPYKRDINWSDDSVTAVCSPCSTVIVSGAGLAAFAIQGNAMPKVTVPLERALESASMRLGDVGTRGKRAWSSLLWRAS